MKKYFSILILFFLFALKTVQSQHSQTLYHMDRLPQITTMNPALQPECNFFLGLPGISGLNMNFGNDFVNYEDVIFQSPNNDSLITFLHPDAKIDDFLNTLNEKNAIFLESSVNLFSFGFRAGEGYFTFGTTLKSEFNYAIPKDLISLVLKGNEQFAGETAEFGNFSLNTNNYVELALGYSQNVFDNLSIGFKAKYLNGITSFTSKKFDLGLYTSELGDSMSLTADIEMQGVAPVSITTDSLGYIDEINEKDIGISDAFTNPGFAFDIGATYRPTDDILISASIVDLGFISYQNFAHTYRVTGQYSFTGIDVSSQFTGGDENGDLGQEILDSLESSIEPTYNEDGFYTTLGSKIYIGGRYYLTDKVDFGLLSRTRFIGDRVQQSFTFTANTRPIRGVSFTASYSIMNHAYNNLGMGIALRLGPLQLYTMSDMYSVGLWPHKSQAFNMRFGLNFVFGCNKKKRILQDEPMLY